MRSVEKAMLIHVCSITAVQIGNDKPVGVVFCKSPFPRASPPSSSGAPPYHILRRPSSPSQRSRSL